MVRLRLRFHHRLHVFGTGMQEQMHMRVDQPGHQGLVAQIDHLGAGRMGDGGAHRPDTVALHQDLAGADHASGPDIEQPRRMQDDLGRRTLLRLGRRGKKQERKRA